MPVTTNDNPIEKFNKWYEEAVKSEPVNPNAMALATATLGGVPSVRMVLLKDVCEKGFTFYTNLGSRKAVELDANPVASLCFYWKSLGQQIRIEGAIERVTDAEADAYFASRPRTSRIGAWASKQTQPLKGRFELEARIAKFTTKFLVGEIPRPDFWSGYRVVPTCIEFWHEHEFRLHDRMVFIKSENGWKTETLYP